MTRSQWSLIIVLFFSVTLVTAGLYLRTDPKENTPHSAPPSENPQEEKFSLVHTIPPAPSTEGYVGSQACQECHAEICKTYQSHPMSFSSQPVLGDLVFEDYEHKTSFQSPLTHVYEVEKKEGKVYHHEKRMTPEEELVYDKSEPIDFAIGSGKRGRSYVINHAGLLFMSPISWYTGKQRWDLSPGYQPGHHKQFERRLIDGCIQCHIGSVSKTKGIKDHFDPTPFKETAIGCERCHGPGEPHIQWHLASEKQQKPDPIVNPINLSPAARDAVCYQCHLTGEGRILRYGRGEFDFRPGNLIEDLWIVFQEGDRITDTGDTQAVSQVEQMHRSQCYLKSAGQMGCISCHDPHQFPSKSERISYFESRCLKCHGESTTECTRPEDSPEQAKESCISCHMPKRSAFSVPHTSLTDHRIIRHKNQPPQTSAQTERFSDFRKPEDENAAYDIQRARGFFYVSLAETRNDLKYAQQALQLLLPLLHKDSTDEDLITQVGLAYNLLGEKAKAKAILERALKVNPNSETALRKLTEICHDTGDYKSGIEYGKRFIEINPWRSLIYGRLVHMLGLTQQFDEGIEYANRGLKINPSIWQLHGWLAQVYEQRGQTELSQQHQKKLQPFLPQR
ncbi:tetratricopeptide repeat protein [Gimesia fumaroli]|uniref:Photosystem I assembly protein Ycf3 n=1 Tax=Gimesia fumaroli TaxID=2527976 RepID=A0A518IAA2_9PLAN|nr:multiheme c-type cytochrome [Gimesia fumaroli]QDV49949.1 Photosystem I assembly protein Ycf3 [Gimesia fumaroli]